MKPNSSTARDPADRGVTRRGVLRTGAAASVALVTGLAVGAGSAAAMNKAELIDSIASEADITKADAKKALDAFIDTTTKALAEGNPAFVVGFGTFSISKRSARKGRNPQTGKEIKIPAKNGVRFDPAPEFAAALDLIPGRGDERRLSARKKKKKKKRHRRAVRRRRRDTVVIDGEAIVREIRESEESRESDESEQPRDSGLSKAAARRALDAFIDTTTKALAEGNPADVVGFGSFSISKRSARKGRNPQTGKEIKIPAKKVVKFKPGAELSEKIK
mgnify:CR=1 FL=1